MPAFPIVLNRQPGIYFARTIEGIELPVVDVTHKAFAVSLTAAEQQAQIDQFMREQQPLQNMPPVLRRLALRLFLRGSILADGIRGSDGTFLSGMNTYLLKLGPQHFTSSLDQKIAGALPGITVRLRLQDMAQLMAEALAPRLRGSPGRPLWFINIAGGPAMDTLNALLLLHRDAPDLLVGRPIVIRVLDQDGNGPTFGRHALEALQSFSAPLSGLQIDYRHVPYDWSRAADVVPTLKAARDTGAIVMVSSEGGLFEYGSNYEIVSTLKAVRETLPEALVAGSVTRNDEAMKLLRLSSKATTIPRGIEFFRTLASRAGWQVDGVIERAFSDQVLLR